MSDFALASLIALTFPAFSYSRPLFPKNISVITTETEHPEWVEAANNVPGQL
jgi:hypothetical protein